jgi:hypothetical protein
MPDVWETDRGLDPETADHNGDDDADGYTNIEEYLHYRSLFLITGNNDQDPDDSGSGDNPDPDDPGNGPGTDMPDGSNTSSNSGCSVQDL